MDLNLPAVLDNDPACIISCLALTPRGSNLTSYIPATEPALPGCTRPDCHPACIRINQLYTTMIQHGSDLTSCAQQ